MRLSIVAASIVLAALVAGCASAPVSAPVQSEVGIAAGATAPAFTLKTLGGEPASLSDYKDRPVLINFWASWCGPCRTEMPEIIDAYRAHRDDGLVVLAIDNTELDLADDVQAFVDEFKLPFPVLMDEAGDVVETYGVSGLPTSIFIDRTGVVRAVNAGPMTGEQIADYLKEITP